MPSTNDSPCPSPEFWRRIDLEDVSPAEREALDDHLEVCEPCVDLMVGLSARWSRVAGSAGREGKAIGDGTIGFLARVAADPPEATEPGPTADARAIVAPEIPGLADLEVVGRGGMGVVFRATEVELARQVAVKVLSAGARLAPSARARAIREAMLMASLKHPNVVPVYRSGEVEGMPYLVMEWVEGGTLQGRIESRTLTTREAARAVRDLALAVAEAHAMGIVHRDLKPENVLIAPSPGGFVPKLTDFGLARRGEHDGVTETGLVIGTPGYMAPEQTGLDPGLGEVGPATDIHGLGAILFACLAGRAPYSGQTSWETMVRSTLGTTASIRDLRRDIPRDLATIVDKCLQQSPARRYRSSGELADDLGRFLDGRPIAARPISRVGRAVKWSRRHPAMAASAVLLAVSAFAGVAGLAYHVSTINRNLRDLADEQGRTKRALVSATSERDRANRARDQARRAMGSLTDEVVDRMVMRGKALDDPDRAFLRKVRGYFEEWPTEPDPESSLKFRAEGLVRVGDVFHKVDQYEDAFLCYRAALAATDEASRRRIASDWIIVSRLRAFTALQRIYTLTNRPEEVLATCRAAVAMLESMEGLERYHRIDLATWQGTLGIGLAAGPRIEESEQWLSASLSTLETLRLEAPDDFTVRFIEQLNYFNAGQISARVGRLALAEARFRKLIELTEAARSAFPAHVEVLGTQILAYEGLVGTIEKARPAEALTIQLQMMDRCRSYLADHPEDLTLRVKFVYGASQVFSLGERLGHPGDGEADLERAVADATRMMEAEPAIYDRSRAMVAALLARARLFAATGRPRLAVEDFDRLASVLEPWTKLQGRAAEVVPGLMQGRRAAASLLQQMGEPAEAARRLAMGLDHAEPKDQPRLHLEIARLRLAVGDKDGARADAREASASPELAGEADRLLSEIDGSIAKP